MTKTAQLAVSRGLAEALAGTGITVNCVLPGPTRSRGVGDFVEALAEARRQDVRGIRNRVLSEGPSDVAHQAVRETRGSGVAGRLRRKPARVGDNGRRAARRRRGGEKRILGTTGRKHGESATVMSYVALLCVRHDTSLRPGVKDAPQAISGGGFSDGASGGARTTGAGARAGCGKGQHAARRSTQGDWRRR